MYSTHSTLLYIDRKSNKDCGQMTMRTETLMGDGSYNVVTRIIVTLMVLAVAALIVDLALGMVGAAVAECGRIFGNHCRSDQNYRQR